MPQKALLKAGKKINKKQQAANRHGKTPQQRKGKFERPPKKGNALEEYKDSKEITKAINAANESTIAAAAERSGGRLKTLKAPPPALAPKDQVKQSKKAKHQQALKEAAARDDDA